MTAYFITDDDNALDKDGYDPIPFTEITLWNFGDYAYESRGAAEGKLHHLDPEGRTGLQITERDIEFNVV